uniref:Uncharacterized protein n=1 Tax=Arundo donax TaxID=35708 RepID=A0A0A9BZX9_ARUDO
MTYIVDERLNKFYLFCFVLK